MIITSEMSPLDGFECHGIKTVSSFDYFLLVDEKGQCVIMQVASDDSTFLFALMPTNPASIHGAQKAADITAFWASPASHSYTYLFEC